MSVQVVECATEGLPQMNIEYYYQKNQFAF